MGINPNEIKKHTSKRLKNRNRRERKFKAEIKERWQFIAMTSNEKYREEKKE